MTRIPLAHHTLAVTLMLTPTLTPTQLVSCHYHHIARGKPQALAVWMVATMHRGRWRCHPLLVAVSLVV